MLEPIGFRFSTFGPRYLSVISALTVLCVVGPAQVNTANITGTIQDPAGRVIPMARVDLINELRNVRRSTATNSLGQYEFRYTPSGRYTLTATVAGFQEQARHEIELTAGQSIVIDLTLQITASRQSVTVQAATPALDAVTSDQHWTVDTRSIRELPSPKMDWTTMLPLDPGVTISNGGVSLNGLPSAGFKLTVDGTNGSADAEQPQLGFYGAFNIINTINSDAIEEVSISKGIAPASVSGTLSGNVNLITKSGTNQFHGSLLEMNGVAAYDARNQFLKTKPGTTYNQNGGSLGGPVLRNKLFFFGNYQGATVRSFTALNGSVPTAEFLNMVLAVAPKYKTAFAQFPLPNQPYAPGSVTGQYISSGTSKQDDSNAVARLDYYLNPSNWVTVRATRSRPSELMPRVEADDPRIFSAHNVGLNVQYTHSGQSWTSVTRFGYNKERLDRVDAGWLLGLDEITYGGFDTQGGQLLEMRDRTTSFEHNVSLVRGRHSIEFGGIFQRLDSGKTSLPVNTFTYSSLSDLLANIPGSVQIQFGMQPFNLHMYQYGGFFQDDIRVSPNFTLNVGVRYDYFSVPRENNGLLFNRLPTALGTGFGPYASPNSVYEAYHANVAPRVGFAWHLGGKTVVRGGAGSFFTSHAMFGGPINLPETAANVPFRLTLNRAQALQQGLSYPVNTSAYQAQLQSQGAQLANSAINQYFPNPYSMQWTLGIQRELPFRMVLDTAYVGTRGVHLNTTLNQNLPDRITGISPYPAFGTFLDYEASEASRYNGWQSSLKKRFSAGLQFGVSFTWSSNLAFGGDDLLQQSAPQDVYNLRADYGPTPWDIRRNFTTNFVYELPLVRALHADGRVAKTLLGGWQISGILTALSGAPVNITINNSSIQNSRPDVAPGVNQILPNYQNTLLYLNPAAFLQIPIIQASGATERDGNLSRNAVRAPGMWNLDASLAKSLRVRERWNLQLRADLFNSLNHTNLSGLNTNLSSGSFGQLTSATSRSMQLGAHLTF